MEGNGYGETQIVPLKWDVDERTTQMRDEDLLCRAGFCQWVNIYHDGSLEITKQGQRGKIIEVREVFACDRLMPDEKTRGCGSRRYVYYDYSDLHTPLRRVYERPDTYWLPEEYRVHGEGPGSNRIPMWVARAALRARRGTITLRPMREFTE